MILNELVHRRGESRRRSAFTLLEVLVVVAILVVLASVASIYVFKYLADAKVDAAKADCKTLAEVGEHYALKHEEWPTQIEQLRPYIKETTKNPFIDPWGNQYQITAPIDVAGKQRVRVWTKTPDGEIDNFTK